MGYLVMKSLLLPLCFIAMLHVNTNINNNHIVLVASANVIDSNINGDAYEYYDEDEEEEIPVKTNPVQTPRPPMNNIPVKEDEYEYYDEEEEEAEELARHQQQQYEQREREKQRLREIEEQQAHMSGPPQKPPGKYGFYTNNRGKPIISSGPIITPKFINKTMIEFDCVLRKDIGTKRDMLSPADIAALEAAKNLEHHGIANPNDDEEIINRILKQNNFMDEEEDANAALAQQKLDEDAALGEQKGSNNGKQKRLSFREKEMLKMEAKKAEYARQQRAAALYRLGPSCEDRICYSCKLVVEEFGLAVINAVRDPKYNYVMDIAEDKFCNRRELYMKYKPQVFDMCNLLVNVNQDYKNLLVAVYEQEDPNVVAASNDASNERRLHYWDFLKNHLHAQTRYMEERKRSVCVGIGACHSSDFEIPMSPVYRQQEFWNETCYICQAAVKDMEQRAILENGVTEKRAVGIVSNTCKNMGLYPSKTSFLKAGDVYDDDGTTLTAPPKTSSQETLETLQYETCTNLTSKRLLDDLGWILKVHVENVDRKMRSDIKFEDKACNEVKYCEKWVEPELQKKKELEQSVEAVYS